MIFFAHHSFLRATCCQTTNYLFNCASCTLFLSFLFTYIHFFHLSYLGVPIFPFGAPKFRAQWQTYCRTTYTFFIVHHLHSCNLSFPHIYIIFIFPILGSLNFLSWVPTFPFGAHDLGAQWQICCFIFPFHTHILLIFPILGSLNFLSRVPLNFRLGLIKSPADPSGRLAVELTIYFSLYIIYIIFILRFHIYIIFIFPILGPLLSYLGAPKFSFGSPKTSGPSGSLAVKLLIPFSLYIMYIILIFPFHRYTIFSSFLSWGPLTFLSLGHPKSR